ncbi:MAG: PLP-dependent transferase [Synergistaceae bacterium]|jgi:O-acetylhomoserine/O-acetylserine sulfhydrylase-like pyridoxal-dependent enzyme|nr:PLP-dependent transferase [Synergistaceae bacterium]
MAIVKNINSWATVRLSIGTENVNDIIADLKQAFGD